MGRPQVTILLTGTNWWQSPARLSLALARTGSRIAVMFPVGSPVHSIRAVSMAFPYSAMNPVASLGHAIRDARPDLIIPTDDRTVSHLHQLHALSDDPQVRALVEHSIGSPGGYSSLRVRAEIMNLAKEEGILVPESMALSDTKEMEKWQGEHTFPWVLKSDGSCGGTGVRIVGSMAEARRAYRRLAAYPTLASAVKRLVVNRDPFPLRTWLDGTRPSLMTQAFISGVPANCTAVCWKGEVLAAFSVAVCTTIDPTGAASIVRIIDNPAMIRAAEKLARRLGLSGFCGLDFMIEDKTGAAYFIELNPRVTQLCHLPLGAGRDLVAAFQSRISGAPLAPAPCITQSDTIAIFPNAWLQDPNSKAIASSFHDVPWDEPGLVAELKKGPWTDRGMLSRVLEAVRRIPQFLGGEPKPSAPKDQEMDAKDTESSRRSATSAVLR